MPFEIDLRKYFTPKAVAESLQQLPLLTSPVLDRIYPESKRRQHPLPVLGIDVISKVIKNVPVVRRGSPAVSINTGERQITYLEPQPVEVSTFIGGVELNNLKLLDDKGIEQYVAGKIDDLRQSIRKTTEAIAGQSLAGSISYPMKTSGGYDIYSVDFGATLEFVPTKLWNAADKTLGEILKDIIEINKLLNQNGYGSDIAYLVGSDVFVAVANKVITLSDRGTINAQITEKGITIAGFTIELFAGVYENPSDGTISNVIPSNKLCAVALDAPFSLYYCALDDIDAGLLPMPFYASPERKKNPSGIEVVGKSKPLPVSIPKGICWSQVI
ncbi:MAG: major capsid protein [Nitrospinae bacterium]|nr:major capsid protein [Nitrospinota bacterium]